MFIEQGIKPENEFWKYLVGSLIIATSAIAGQLPLTLAILFSSKNKGKMPTSNQDLMHFFEPNLQLFLILLTFVFAVIGIYYVVTKFHHQTMISIVTARKKTDWRRILFSFFVWAFISISLTMIGYFLSPADYEINFKPIPFATLFFIGLFMFPIQTTTEEFIFRGYLMQGFANLSKNRWFPLLMTSVLFGSMHILNPEIQKLGYIVLVYYIGTGFLLGIITLMDDGMELALGFHAANNLIGALLITTDWGTLQTYSIFKDVSAPDIGAEILVPLLILYPILLFLFAKKYGWTNWKQKLFGEVQTQNSNLKLKK